MIGRKVSRAALCAFACLALPVITHAATFSYNFTYTNVTDQYATVTSTGSGTGSFTMIYTGLGAQLPSALTAFSFTDTITESSPTPSSSTFTYTLSDLYPASIILTGSLANPTFADLAITTQAVAGSDVNVGSDSFSLFFSGANPGTGSTQTPGVDLGYDTTGDINLSPATTTPEPSGLAVVGFLFGVGAMISQWHRFARARRSSSFDH